MLSESRRQAIQAHLGILENGRRIGPDATSDMLADDLRDLLAALTEAEQERDRLREALETLADHWLSDRAHTYASENADLYRGFDSGRRRSAEELRAVLAGTAQEQTR